MVEVVSRRFNDGKISPVQWYLGLVIASIFSLAYFVVPFYLLSAIILLVIGYPSYYHALLFASPLIISGLIPPIPLPWIVKRMTPINHYFDYEEIHEVSPINVIEEIRKGTNYLAVYQPHGTISYGGMLLGVNADPAVQCRSLLSNAPIWETMMRTRDLIHSLAAHRPQVSFQLQSPTPSS